MLRRILASAIALLFLLSLNLSVQRCATPTPPRGGAIDSVGPQLVPEESTPNFQTDFRPERIELTFDEWVELDFQQEIVISPPLDLGTDNRPQLRRRTLVIPLEGVELRDSVTYVVNIGAAIQDLNEGNPTENLRFVFSTGPVLDTAAVSGTVVDEYSGEPLEDIAVTLFEADADTAVFTSNPLYFAISAEDGSFTISNVKPGDYRLIALQRNPGARGYFPDYEGVFPPLAVGFLDSVVSVGGARTEVEAIRVSPVAQAIRTTEVDAGAYGIIKIGVNQPAAGVDLRSSRDYVRTDLGDTLRLYYRTPADDTLLIGRDTIFSDTVVVRQSELEEAVRQPLRIVDRGGGKVNPGEGIAFILNRPVESIDTAGVRLFRDTFPEPIPFTFAVDTVDPAAFRLQASWEDGGRYAVEILPGAITDWYGETNADSISRTVNVGAAEAYGVLTVTLDNINPAVDYILRLVNEEGAVITGTRRFIQKRFTYTAAYRSLAPGTYLVELIYDSNGNQRFDSGDLRFGRQPEAVQRFEIEPLRANWEVEKTIDLENN